ncbi:MAG: hypothetical protein SWK90_20195 [Chloroflexota bacterium]|nr:hypothetical protein [Chloroflexota bacterium]
MSQFKQNQVLDAETAKSARQRVCRLGFWTSILTAVTAAVALGIAVTTAPARSGPNCPPLVDMGVLESCVTYPYTDVAAFVPIEYIWMYPAFLLALLFVVMVICIHHYAAVDKKVFSQIALSSAVISAATHAMNYFIQLAVVQPSLLKGELEGLALFSQYNPHGIFIALEDLGYFLMGITFLFVAVAFVPRNRLERAIRFTLIAGSILVVGGLILMALLYGSDLEYRYEVLSLTVDWIVLIVSGTLLSVFFRRAGRAVQL